MNISDALTELIELAQTGRQADAIELSLKIEQFLNNQWQPIESAPRDGSLLVVYSIAHGYVVAWWDQVDGGGHPENGPPVYWWVSDHCEFIDGPSDAPVLWRLLEEPSDIVKAALLRNT